METRKKGLFKRILSATPPFKKEEDRSWKVILKGLPDKQAEENFANILMSRLAVGADDVSQITQSLPIVLFGDLTSQEAEKIKIFLNETGVRSAISNDSEETAGLGKVTWPKKVTLADLSDMEGDIPPPPFFASTPSTVLPAPKPSEPVLPPKPVIPEKPKFENEKLIAELEKFKTELKAPLERLEKLLQSLRGPVPPVPGLKGDSLPPPRVR